MDNDDSYMTGSDLDFSQPSLNLSKVSSNSSSLQNQSQDSQQANTRQRKPLDIASQIFLYPQNTLNENALEEIEEEKEPISKDEQSHADQTFEEIEEKKAGDQEDVLKKPIFFTLLGLRRFENFHAVEMYESIAKQCKLNILRVKVPRKKKLTEEDKQNSKNKKPEYEKEIQNFLVNPNEYLGRDTTKMYNSQSQFSMEQQQKYSDNIDFDNENELKTKGDIYKFNAFTNDVLTKKTLIQDEVKSAGAILKREETESYFFIDGYDTLENIQKVVGTTQSPPQLKLKFRGKPIKLISIEAKQQFITQLSTELVLKNYAYLDRSFELDSFSFGVLHQSKNKKYPQFRKYWDHKTIQEAGLKFNKPRLLINYDLIQYQGIEIKKLQRQKMLRFSLIFQVNFKIEAKISIDIEKIQVYEDPETKKLHWYAHLLQHPTCEIHLLDQSDYFTPHIKYWIRYQNFLVKALEDNIDRIYVGHRTIAHLTFSSSLEELQKSKVYTDSIHSIASVIDKKPLLKTYDEVRYISIPLEINTYRLQNSPLQFDTKFMLLILISHNIIDIYKFSDSFLGQLAQVGEHIRRETLEMIYFNKYNWHKALNQEEFCDLWAKCKKIYFLRKAILPFSEEEKKGLKINFTQRLVTYTINISPSCDYYSFQDMQFSLSLQESDQKDIKEAFQKFLHKLYLLNFIDEDFKTMEVATKDTLNRARTNYDVIKLLNIRLHFFGLDSKQINQRQFWMYEKDAQSQELYLKILSHLENKYLVNKQKFIPVNYITQICNRLRYRKDSMRIQGLGIRFMRLDDDTIKARNFQEFDGFISEDLLDMLSKSRGYGESPALTCRIKGKYLTLLRDPDENVVRRIELSYNVAQEFGIGDEEQLDLVDEIEIEEIVRYKPAYLNKFAIFFLERRFSFDRPDDKSFEYERKYQYLKDLIQKFYEKVIKYLKDFQQGKEKIIKINENQEAPTELNQTIRNDSSFSSQNTSKSNLTQKLDQNLHDQELLRNSIANLKGNISISRDLLESLEKGLDINLKKLYFKNDPFFKELVYQTLTKTQIDFFEQFKLFVKGGANLFGVIDTSMKLRKGRVFFQIDHNQCTDNDWKICEYVSIIRKPYLNREDYREFKVERKEKFQKRFCHLKNCIIFSADDKDWIEQISDFQNENEPMRASIFEYFTVLWDDFQKNLDDQNSSVDSSIVNESMIQANQENSIEKKLNASVMSTKIANLKDLESVKQKQKEEEKKLNRENQVSVVENQNSNEEAEQNQEISDMSIDLNQAQFATQQFYEEDDKIQESRYLIDIIPEEMEESNSLIEDGQQQQLEIIDKPVKLFINPMDLFNSGLKLMRYPRLKMIQYFFQIHRKNVYKCKQFEKCYRELQNLIKYGRDFRGDKEKAEHWVEIFRYYHNKSKQTVPQYLGNRFKDSISDIHQQSSSFLVWHYQEGLAHWENFEKNLSKIYKKGGQKINRINELRAIQNNIIHPKVDKFIIQSLVAVIVYKYDLLKLSTLFGCNSESELFSGKIYFDDQESAKLNISPKPIISRKPKLMDDYVRCLAQRHKKIFYDQLGIKDIDTSNSTQNSLDQIMEKKLMKASALYFASNYHIFNLPQLVEIMMKQRRKRAEEIQKKVEKVKLYVNKINELFDYKGCSSLPWIVAGEEIIQLVKQSSSSMGAFPSENLFNFSNASSNLSDFIFAPRAESDCLDDESDRMSTSSILKELGMKL